MINLELLKSILMRYIVEIVLILLSLGVSLFSYHLYSQSSAPVIAAPAEQSRKVVKDTIAVELSGAVLKPDVYEVPTGTRLHTVLKKAGGLSESADKSFFGRNFNTSRVLHDQEKVYVPDVNEIENGIFAEENHSILEQKYTYTEPQTQAEPFKTSVNAATLTELDSLPGVGLKTAQKIIDNRPYSSLDELTQRSIVTESTLEKIKDQIGL